jgi:hypothetical protein
VVLADCPASFLPGLNLRNILNARDLFAHLSAAAKGDIMQRTILALLILGSGALLGSGVPGANAATPHHKAAASSSGAVTYNRDSKDPNIGWHWDSNGMRVCHQDCDNPEIPGSGYTCRNVQAFGMTMRECDSN